MSWRGVLNALTGAAMWLAAAAFVVFGLSWLFGCATHSDKPPAVGAVPAVKDAASFTAAHVLRAQEVLAVETTPAAKLAASHLRIAAASLPAPTLADRKRAASYEMSKEPVELTTAAGLLNEARESLSDHVAAAERKARQDEFQQGEARRAASLLLVSSTVIGGLAVASGVAYIWLRLKSLIGTALLLGAVSAVLLFGARLIVRQWVENTVFAAFGVALVCIGVVVWRAWLAPSPKSRLDGGAGSANFADVPA